MVLPAPGQGALAIETRAEDAALYTSIDRLDIERCVAAERGLLALVEGGCSVPLGTHARITDDGTQIELAAVLAEAGRLRRALVRAFEPAEAAALAFRILRPASDEAVPSWKA